MAKKAKYLAGTNKVYTNEEGGGKGVARKWVEDRRRLGIKGGKDICAEGWGVEDGNNLVTS